MLSRTRKSAYAIAALTVMLSGAATAQDADITGTVDCIAPAGPGGGWDFTCRSLGQIIGGATDHQVNVQTKNMPGAGGGVGFAHIITKRGDDPKVIAAASTATTARLAQGQFPGMTADMVRWVGAIGADPGIIAVKKDSPYTSLDQLLAALKEDPASVTFAGASAVGGWDHLKILMTAHEAGVKNLNKIKYLSYNNGGSAVTQVIGGHIDALVGVVSSSQGFIESGDLRPLAVLNDKRLAPPLDEIPTSTELGLDVEASNWRGFYMPKGVSDAEYEWWVSTLRQASETDEWRKIMKQNGLVPFERYGKDFDTFVNDQVAKLNQVSREVGLIQE
jgi:putative tricarboxylic transport membrane protein